MLHVDYKFGEKLHVEDLMHVLLIPSANDAANVLAEHVSGSIASFCDLMNKRAKELGCTGSNFANPSGVHDDNLYTTAYDLSLIARHALNFEVFRKIITTTKYTLPSTEAYPKADRTFAHTNLLLNPNYKNYYYEYATGIKTGYTDAAKDCIVASAKKDDIEFIAVTLGNSRNDNWLREKYVDCKTLFNFAFDNYTTYYKNLQLEKSKKESLAASLVVEDLKNIDNEFFKTLSKIVSVLAILLAMKLIFGRRKKKNHYTFKGRKKAKHRK